MKLIPLTKGYFAKVDDEDYERVNKWKWYTHIVPAGNKRAVRNGRNKSNKRITIIMTRVILNYSGNEVIDHINGDSLDNRKSNLRICSQSENVLNRSINKKNTSGYKGVTWNEDCKKWRTQISFNKRKIYLGVYSDKIQAANVYNKAAIKFFGEFARLNII